MDSRNYKKATKPNKFNQPKTCQTCKAVHIESPIGSLICEKGLHWFNCGCGSTLINSMGLNFWTKPQQAQAA